MLDRNDRALSWQPSGTGAVANLYDRGPWDGHGIPSSDERDQAFDPLKLFWLAYRYRWLIAVLLAVGLVLGTVTTLMQSPKYAATARIEIMVPTARVLEDMDLVAQSSDTRTFETAREKLKSRELARRVALELDLVNDAAFILPRPDFSVGNIFARVFGTPAAASLDDYNLAQREAMAIGRLLADLSVGLVRGTSLLEVRFENHRPEQASRIANQVVRSYMDLQVDRTIETSELARQFVDEQVVETKARLEVSEAALVKYAKDQKLGSAGADGSLIAASITAINDALAEAIQTRFENERLVAQIEAGRAAQLKQVLDSEAIQGTRAKLTDLKAEYQQKLGTFKPGFPDMQRLAAQIAEYERQLEAEVDIIANSIRLANEASRQEEADLRQKLSQLQAEQVAFRDKNIEYTILNREVESNRAQYQSLIDKRNELGVVSDLRRVNIDIVDSAVTPGSPFEPSLLRNLLLFFGGAAALSVAAVYLLELMNNKFSVPDQIETELQLPVLGLIPKADGDKLRESLANPRSPISEAYRSLRTSLQFAGSEGAPRTLLFTSAEPGESKSTSAAKLAEEFAAIGNKVLIIDCDLRRPRLHRIFDADNNMGLSNLLTNTVNEEDIAQLFRPTNAHPELSFLSTGPMVPNPADLLSSPRMSAILAACTKSYSIIILDGPPVIGLSDALILARLSEATILVVAAHQATRKSVGAALKRLRSAGGHVIGAMFGKFDVDRIEYSYSYRYMYEGYYGYDDKPAVALAQAEERGETIGSKGKLRNSVSGLYRRHLRPLLERS